MNNNITDNSLIMDVIVLNMFQCKQTFTLIKFHTGVLVIELCDIAEVEMHTFL